MLKPTPILAPAVLALLTSSALGQQGALHGDAPDAQQAITSHDTVLRRTVIDAATALGPGREAVTTFDADDFRTRAGTDPGSLSQGTLVSEQTAAAPLVLPPEFISVVRGDAGALSAGSIDPATAYFRESAIGLGFYYGYETPAYKLDVTARTVTTSDGSTGLGPAYGRFALSETREGFFGTVHAANVSYAIEITCGTGDACIGAEDLDALYASLLSCEADGNCYDIGGGAE